MTNEDQDYRGRRASDHVGLPVVDTRDSITSEDLAAMKQVIAYWRAGRLILGAIVALGAAGLAMTSLYDTFSNWIRK